MRSHAPEGVLLRLVGDEAGVGEDTHGRAETVEAVVHAARGVVAGGKHGDASHPQGELAPAGDGAQHVPQGRGSGETGRRLCRRWRRGAGGTAWSGWPARRCGRCAHGSAGRRQSQGGQAQRTQGCGDAAGGDARVQQNVGAPPDSSRLLPSEPLASICTVNNGVCPHFTKSITRHPLGEAAASRSGRWMAVFSAHVRLQGALCRGTSTREMSAPTARSLPTRSS